MTPTDFPSVEAPSTTSDRTTDPSPDDMVARLRPSYVADKAAIDASVQLRDKYPRLTEALNAAIVENNRLKSDAADLITSLQARAEKAERERDETTRQMMCGDEVLRQMRRAEKAEAEAAALREALTFYRDGFAPRIGKPMPGASGITFHPTEALLEDCGNRALAALANKETENV